MTSWLLNFAAYSVQLAALVCTGVLILACLGVTAPSATLRFWRVLLAVSLVWPAYQLWALEALRFTPAGPWGGGFSTVRWMASSGTAEMRAGLAAISPAVTAMVLTVLAFGVALRLTWLGLGLMRLRSMRSASEPADALASIAWPLQHDLGVTADIRFSDDVESPATIGARHPVILLPRRVGELPAPLQRAVLCHELIHVRRQDWLPTLLEEVWCAALWFHPAARVLVSRIGLAREALVDQSTRAHTSDRRAYVAALLEFATAQPRPLGANGMVGRRNLERRISLIGQEVQMTRSSLVVRLAVASGVVILATLATSSHVPINAMSQAQVDRVYKPGQDAGITLPRVTTEVKPDYTPAALQARIQGSIWLKVIVLASGGVGEITVTKSLDEEHGLDQQAVDAARQWQFEPGTSDGKPVAVEVTIEMTFTLK